MRLRVSGLLLVFSLTLTGSSVAQQNDEVIYTPGDGVTLPKVTKTVYARHTLDKNGKLVRGRVVLTCVVSKAGVPTGIEVTQKLEEDQDAAAVTALEQWRFKAGTKDGEPVPVRIIVEMTFTVR